MWPSSLPAGGPMPTRGRQQGRSRLPRWPKSAEHVPVEELARRQGVRPVESPADMARPGTPGSAAKQRMLY
jgi:hypothetical protein